MKGLFVTFEGTEGSGKTSVIRRVQSYFENKGIPVLVTREPGGSHIAEQIRSILLSKENKEMDVKTEALLFAASRRQHLTEIIRPALNEGKLVLCDRYEDSSLVYQGIARGIGYDDVLSINRFAIDDSFPDLTLFVDVRPEVGLERVFNTKDREVNRLDLETMSFHRDIYDGYMSLIEAFPERMKKIPGEQPLEEVVQAVIEEIGRSFET